MGTWGWIGVGVAAFYAVAGVWLWWEVRNAPTVEEYLSGEWARKRRRKREGKRS